jgi:hypothetical protein
MGSATSSASLWRAIPAPLEHLSAASWKPLRALCARAAPRIRSIAGPGTGRAWQSAAIAPGTGPSAASQKRMNWLNAGLEPGQQRP